MYAVYSCSIQFATYAIVLQVCPVLISYSAGGPSVQSMYAASYSSSIT